MAAGLLLCACGDDETTPTKPVVASDDPATIYDVQQLRAAAALELVDIEDVVVEVGGGRFVREVSFGFASGGFPTASTQFDAGARLFVETDAAGTPLHPVDAVALNLRATNTPGFTQECALNTGHVCAITTHHLLTPGRMSPSYPNAFSPDAPPIADSNLLYFNLLSEMKQGKTASGQALAEPVIRRAYDVQIARAGMLLLTAIDKKVAALNWAASAPLQYVVAGHSKWAAAAAQMVAVDDRVVGGVAAGFPLDWLKWLQLAKSRWMDDLGIDFMALYCTTPATPCEWTQTDKLLDLFASTDAAPLACGTGRCALTGEAWLRQLDFRTLLANGAFANKKFALIRNGEEAHHVDVERDAYDQGIWPSQFLFLPDSPHVFKTAQHASFWRHWIRHNFDGAATATLQLNHEQVGAGLVVNGVVSGQANIVSADVYFRLSSDGNFGSLTALPEYQQQCQQHNNCPSPWRSWSTECGPVTVAGGAISAPSCTVPLTPTTDVALVLMATIDDGSGDTCLVSSAVEVLR